MIHFHEFGLKHYVVIGVLLLLVITRILHKKQLMIQYKDYISIFIFVVLAIIVGIEFWTAKIYIGLVMLVLGSFAIAKLFYDKMKQN
jgi:hypothetical protein